MTTVLVVDDHPVVRDGVKAALAGSTLDVVGEAASGEAALVLVAELRPEVVLMDLGLPGISGVEATRRLLADAPGTAVLAFTMYEDDESIFAAIRAGALGYLVKGADRAELVRAIESVAAGEAVFLGPGVARRVLAYFAGSTQRVADPLPGLTEREREILDLMATGWGNQNIARRLQIAPKTVRNHVSSVIGKLQVASRGEAIVRARSLGYGQPDR